MSGVLATARGPVGKPTTTSSSSCIESLLFSGKESTLVSSCSHTFTRSSRRETFDLSFVKLVSSCFIQAGGFSDKDLFTGRDDATIFPQPVQYRVESPGRIFPPLAHCFATKISPAPAGIQATTMFHHS